MILCCLNPKLKIVWLNTLAFILRPTQDTPTLPGRQRNRVLRFALCSLNDSQERIRARGSPVNGWWNYHFHHSWWSIAFEMNLYGSNFQGQRRTQSIWLNWSHTWRVAVEMQLKSNTSKATPFIPLLNGFWSITIQGSGPLETFTKDSTNVLGQICRHSLYHERLPNIPKRTLPASWPRLA